MYDALELDVDKNNKKGTKFGENQYYASAVCLVQKERFKPKRWEKL